MFRISSLRTLGAAALALLPCAHAAETERPLSLDDAVALSVANQPLLDAQAAAARSARASAIADAQLPDPKLVGGVTDLPIAGADGYTLRDGNTQLMVGLSQAFPRGATRALKGERGRAEAEMLEADRDMREREIARDAALAWLDAWKAERATEIALDAAHESDLQLQATEISYAAGRSTQADVLAMRVALAAARDEADDFAQQAQHGRSELSRWIGDSALRPIARDLPDWGAPAPYVAAVALVHDHPHLRSQSRQLDLARAEVDLARQGYRPEIDVSVGYGYRRDFADYASLTVGIDLPFFTGQRQDRMLASKLADEERAEKLLDDAVREHAAQLRLNSADWLLLQSRLERYGKEIVPQGQQRVEATLAAWRSGAGTLAGVLDARRMLLETRLKQLDLQLDAAKHRVKLRYLAGA